MTHMQKSLIVATALACTCLAACVSQPVVERGREGNVLKAQFAAQPQTKPVMAAEEGEKIYTNYLEASGKPVRPTSSMEQNTK